MPRSFKEILDSLPAYKQRIKEMKEILLANLVMLGEIPAPTFDEAERIEFLINRFKEAELCDHNVDEVGNGIGRISGNSDSERTILLVAHADTVFNQEKNHTIEVDTQTATGPGVADNSLGMATLASIPFLLDKLDISLNHDLILIGTTRSLGRGDLEGLRHFLTNFSEPTIGGLGLEGVELGRLSHTSIGMRRGVITCRIPHKYDWSRFGESSAILTINEIINKINEIRLPQRPRTSIVLGSIKGGSSFTTARNARLQFEVRSESSEIVETIEEKIQQIVMAVASRSGDSIELDIFAHREPGGLPYAHPLVQNTQKIMQKLDIEARPGPSTSELSIFIDRDIPAITLGLTRGDKVREDGEMIQIEPMYSGITQVLGTLQAIDGGYCEEN